MKERLTRFMNSRAFGVVGASVSREKYGNKVLRCYQQNGHPVYGVNPKEAEIEGARCFASVSLLPDEVESISIITPPAVTEKVVEEAIARGIQNIWMQPGAESQKAIERCQEAGVNVIGDGSCLLVVLGFSEH